MLYKHINLGWLLILLPIAIPAPLIEEEDFGLRLYKKGYKLIYQPEAIVYHGHDRTTFKDLLTHSRSWAKKGAIRVFLKYNNSDYGKYSTANPYFYLFLSPLISAFVTLKIFFQIVKYEKKIIFYSPMIFLNKMSWCLGTYEYLKARENEYSKNT